MAVVIRLRKEGSHDNKVFRVVAAEKSARRDGRFLEILGTYDPNRQTDDLNLNLDKVDVWLGKGAKASDTVSQLIKRARKSAS
ncbi:MAG: 30S ribosomal protein S16 [Verrucomicrobiales bacterium]|nr:30S ribosomal protein S16 [Verrucomicrobiales bacterium]